MKFSYNWPSLKLRMNSRPCLFYKLPRVELKTQSLPMGSCFKFKKFYNGQQSQQIELVIDNLQNLLMVEKLVRQVNIPLLRN